VSAKHPQRSPKRERLTVRVGPLERTLADFNVELSNKMAMAMVAYDGEYGKALRARVWALEHPFRSRGKRLWAFAVGLTAQFTGKKESEAASGRTGEPQPASQRAGQPGISGPGEADPSPVLTEGRDKE
jgi:hypothetical protein